MWKTIFTSIALLFSASTLAAQKPILVVPTGHSSGVQSVSCSADGKYFLTAGGDNLIKIWNAKGQELRTFRSDGKETRQVYLSPDGSQILAAYCHESMNSSILDALTGEEIFILDGQESPLKTAKYSPDSKTIATADEAGVLSLWYAKNGQLLRRWTGHDSTVVSLDFSPDGKQLASLSLDGFSKVWDIRFGKEFWDTTTVTETLSLATPGEALRQIRFSPDGKTLCVAAVDSEAGISLWSIETKKKIATTGGYDCIFSPDGKYVCVFRFTGPVILPADDLSAVPLQKLTVPLMPSDGPMIVSMLEGQFLPDGNNILLNARYVPVILDFRTGKQICAFKGYAEPVQSIAFSPDGKRCLVGSINDILEWDFAEGRPIKRMLGHTDDVPQAKYSPDAQKIVSVSDDYTARVWDAQSGDTLFTAPMGIGLWPIQSYARVLAISPDGQYFVKGHSQDGSKAYPLLSLWNLKDGSPRGTMWGGDSSTLHDVCDLVFSPDGKWLAVLEHGGIYVWDVAANRWKWQHNNIDDWYSSIAFNRDGSQLATNTSNGVLQFWKAQSGKLIAEKRPDLPTSDDPYADLLWLAIQNAGGKWMNDLVFSPDGKWMATTGQNKTIEIWDAQGHKLVRTFLGHDNTVTGLDFSPDSRWLISISTDNTLRIWDVKKGNEAAKIVHLNGENWVVTTPSGLFDASPGAMEIMYFLSGKEVIELDQLKKRYYEPGLISKVLGLASGELRDVQQFQDLPLYPKIEAEIVQNQLNITLSERNGGIGKLSLFVNGTERGPEDINPERKQQLSLDLKTYAKYFRTDTLNIIALRAYNAQGWLKSAAYELTYTYAGAKGSGQSGNTRTSSSARPRLFALVIGTADYSSDKLDLKYADQDAASMAAALASAGKELYGDDVHIRLFTTGSNLTAGASGGIQNEMASKANIQAAFEGYAKPEQVQASDVMVVYFSGHGITYGEAEKAQFYYLTKDITSEDLSDPEVRRNYTISSDTLTEWIKNIAALKQVLILDACNSGKIVESLAAVGQKDLNPSQVRAFDEMKDRTGMFILTGSAADMVSYEASQYGQGLLTYSLLEGMSGLALADDKRVDVMTLFQHSRKRVPELAKSIKGIQNPVLASPVDGGSFYLGRVNGNVKIPLAQLKPIFIRNVFQDEEAFDDVLGLGDALEEYFRQQNAKGAQSKLIYVDVKDYENAYSMKGRYTIRENEVEVSLRLFKGKTVLGGEFKVNGKKDDVPGLVKQILGVVLPIAK